MLKVVQGIHRAPIAEIETDDVATIGVGCTANLASVETHSVRF